MALQWLGPRWRVEQGDIGVGMHDWLRAGIALTVGKRVHALMPPSPLRSLRWQGAAHPRLGMRSQSLQEAVVLPFRRDREPHR